MGDMAEIFRDLRETKKTRKQERLAKADPTGWTQHTPYHWSRTLNGKRLDYWPSTHKFQYEGKVHHGDVLGFIRKRENNERQHNSFDSGSIHAVQHQGRLEPEDDGECPF